MSIKIQATVLEGYLICTETKNVAPVQKLFTYVIGCK